MAAGGLLATQAAAQADVVTTNNFGALNGTQVVVPIQVPIDVCGNAIALIGGAIASCDGGAAAINGGGSDDDGRHQHDDGYDDKKGHGGGEFIAMAEGKYKDDDHGKKHHKGAFNDGGSNIVSSGNYGLLNGTQVVVPIQVPIDISGNAIGLIGGAFASSTGGAAAINESARVEGYDRGRDTEANLISTNNFGFGNGTQIYAPIQVPINVCGNAIALIGGAFAACDGGAIAFNESAHTTEGAHETEANLVSTNNFGLLNGTQLYAPIQVPINVCGNAIALIGSAFASCDGGAIAFNESASTESAQEEALPLVGSLPQLPVVNGLPVVGQLVQNATPAAPKMDNAPGARSAGATEGDDYDDNDGRHGKHGKKHGDDGHRGGAVAANGGSNIVSSNNFGALNGTQVVLPIQIPVDISGNAIGIIGGAFAQSTGGALALNG
ncbi:MAG TPA: chaplin family protein [Asanoa sp.]|nr:chaplin family protein [Asanoa sp.]